MSKFLKCLNSDAVAMISDEAEWLAKYNWTLDSNGYFKNYANGKFLHRYAIETYLNEVDKTKVVDHIDRNPLNNTKLNLRYATRSQNMANRTSQRRLKGVYCRLTKAGLPMFFARIKVNKVIHHLGTFFTEEAASQAYDLAGRKHFGEFHLSNQASEDLEDDE